MKCVGHIVNYYLVFSDELVAELLDQNISVCHWFITVLLVCEFGIFPLCLL